MSTPRLSSRRVSFAPTTSPESLTSAPSFSSRSSSYGPSPPDTPLPTPPASVNYGRRVSIKGTNDLNEPISAINIFDAITAAKLARSFGHDTLSPVDDSESIWSTASLDGSVASDFDSESQLSVDTGSTSSSLSDCPTPASSPIEGGITLAIGHPAASLGGNGVENLRSQLQSYLDSRSYPGQRDALYDDSNRILTLDEEPTPDGTSPSRPKPKRRNAMSFKAYKKVIIVDEVVAYNSRPTLKRRNAQHFTKSVPETNLNKELPPTPTTHDVKRLSMPGAYI